MLDPLDYENRPYFNVLRKKRRRAFWSLTLEKITLHSWRPFFWVLAFCGLWMLEIPAFFGSVIAVLTVIAFLIGMLYFVTKDLLTFTWPSDAEIDKAIERGSALPRGHIALLDDELANPKKHNTRDLWKAAQVSILKSLATLRTPNPRAILSKQDPRALRFVAILLFVAGLLFSGATWNERISNGLFPVKTSHVIAQGQDTHLWITPPSYTQISKTHISGDGTYNGALDIVEGSKLRIRIYSVFGKFLAPKFKNGDLVQTLDYLGEGLYGLETEIFQGKKLSITQGPISRLNINYAYIKDNAPEIVSDIPPTKEGQDSKPTYELLDNAEIRFPLMVKDDYGVKDLHVTMNLNKMVEERPLGDVFEETRLIMSRANTEFKIAPVYNLAWHTWAGLPVTFTFKAIDHKGQSVALNPIDVILPEREFKHPVAKSLIAMRKRLAWDYDKSFADIAENLETLLSAPSYFQNDPMVYLSIRVASLRLHYQNTKPQLNRTKAAQEVIALLWETALSIEDGDLSQSLRELSEAQRALENAMRDPNAAPDEIARMMDDVRKKMQNYFMELQRDMQKRMENGENIPMLSPDQFSDFISPNSLSKLMDEIESALRSGDQEKAQELMSRLQRMMEMMDPSMMPKMPMDMQTMKKGVNELQKLIENQEKLLEQTQEQAIIQRIQKQNKAVSTAPDPNIPNIENMLKEFGMEVAPPIPDQHEKNAPIPTNKVNTKANKIEQEALRLILGQLMLEVAEHIGDIPEAMGLAEQEMRGSSKYLGENDPQSSIPHQEQALEHLKQSQEQLNKQLRSRMQQMVGLGFSGGQRYDPLGRPYGGEENETNQGPHGSDVKVPDEIQKKRVDEILRMLRERSGDRSRSQDELEYFRRLLRQF